MSRNREMLRTLVRRGKTEDQIAAEVPMDLRNVNENLTDDWPIRKRFVAPLEAYLKSTLRQAYALAISHAANNEQLRADPDSIRFIDELRHDFAAFFLTSIEGDDCEPSSQWSSSEAARLVRARDRASYACWLLRLDPARIFPAGPESGPEADEHLIEWTVTYVQGLLDNVRLAGPEAARTPEAVRYLLTLHHVDAVLAEHEDPNVNGWFQNALGYRRGVIPLPAESNRKGLVPR